LIYAITACISPPSSGNSRPASLREKYPCIRFLHQDGLPFPF
jgi:hypothetical protein